MAAADKPVVLDTAALFAAARQRLVRTSILLGIGTNAAAVDPPLSHVLAPEGIFHLNLVPPEIPAEHQAGNAAEFGRWIIAAAFRDMVDEYALFLTRAYEYMWLLKNLQAPAEAEDLMKPTGFERRGIAEQMQRLHQLLDAPVPVPGMFDSLNAVRNCLTHRMGIVHTVDVLAPDDGLSLKWRGIEVVGKIANGVEIPLDGVDQGPIEIPEGGGVPISRFVDKKVAWPVGSLVDISRRQLAEILIGAADIQRQIINRMEQAIVAAGAPAAQ